MAYYLKELLSNPVHNLRGVPWEDVGDDTGVIATTDAGLIHQLANIASTHTGGVVKIDAEHYSLLKKNSNSFESKPLSERIVPRLKAQPSAWMLSDPEQVAALAVENASDKPVAPVATVVEPPKIRRGRAKAVA